MSISFFYSLLGHLLIFLLLFVQLPNWMIHQREEVISTPIIIDLKNVQITSKTNLPAAESLSKENLSSQKAPVVKASVAPKKSPKRSEKKQTPPPTPNLKEAKPDPTAIPIKETLKKPFKAETQKIEKLHQKIKDVTKKTLKTQPSSQEDLKKLLAKVDKMSETITSNTNVVKQGIHGESRPDLSQPLTISELDFLSQGIRSHWNVDLGVEGIDKMIVELRVLLDKTGKVYQVEFLDMARYRSDKAFQSVADSARRAVYICDGQGNDSPFRILAQKRSDTYSVWKDIVFRFNPLDSTVF